MIAVNSRSVTCWFEQIDRLICTVYRMGREIKYFDYKVDSPMNGYRFEIGEKFFQIADMHVVIYGFDACGKRAEPFRGLLSEMPENIYFSRNALGA